MSLNVSIETTLVLFTNLDVNTFIMQALFLFGAIPLFLFFLSDLARGYPQNKIESSSIISLLPVSGNNTQAANYLT